MRLQAQSGRHVDDFTRALFDRAYLIIVRSSKSTKVTNYATYINIIVPYLSFMALFYIETIRIDSLLFFSFFTCLNDQD